MTVKDMLLNILFAFIVAIDVFIFISLMSGCNVRPEASTHDVKIVQFSHDIWEASGLPPSSKCVKNAAVIIPQPREFQLQCGSSSFMSIGCVVNRGVGGLRGKNLYVSPDVPKHMIDAVIVQLTLKSLKECTKEQRRGNRYDPIFIDESNDESVESRIRERLHLIH